MSGHHNGRIVIAENCEPSDARNAWTCSLCGFRGFWQGAPHCIDAETAALFERVRQRERELGIGCRRPMCAPNCQTCPDAT